MQQQIGRTQRSSKWIDQQACQPLLYTISLGCPYRTKYPICKLLCYFAHVYLINEIECLFLAHTIKQTSWTINQSLITHYSQTVCFSFGVKYIDPQEFQCLILYIMLTMYTVKHYLNDDNAHMTEQSIKYCPQFKSVFTNWAKKYGHVTRKISPKVLNNVYRQGVNQAHQPFYDFNLIVDSILQISPAYSSQNRNNSKHHNNNNPNKNNNYHQNQTKTEDSVTPFNFSASGIFDLVAQSDNAAAAAAKNILPKVSLERSLVPTQSKILKLSQVVDIKQQDDECFRIQIGSHQCQSMQQLPPVLQQLGNKQFSQTDKYLYGYQICECGSKMTECLIHNIYRDPQ